LALWWRRQSGCAFAVVGVGEEVEQRFGAQVVQA